MVVQLKKRSDYHDVETVVWWWVWLTNVGGSKAQWAETRKSLLLESYPVILFIPRKIVGKHHWIVLTWDGGTFQSSWVKPFAEEIASYTQKPKQTLKMYRLSWILDIDYHKINRLSWIWAICDIYAPQRALKKNKACAHRETIPVGIKMEELVCLVRDVGCFKSTML